MSFQARYLWPTDERLERGKQIRIVRVILDFQALVIYNVQTENYEYYNFRVVFR